VRAFDAGRSPTTGLLAGMVITLAVVSADSYYLTRQISRLRALQTDLADRSRRDSLQLLRIQNDLNTLGLAMRDMLDSSEPYPLTAWSGQFQRVRLDLEDALRRQDQLAVGARTPEQRQYLTDSLAQFWDAADRIFALAGSGHETEARAQIRISLQADRPRSAPRSRGCSSRTTKANRKPPGGCRASTIRWSGRSTPSWQSPSRRS
jgi:hypothetical protein